MNEPTDLNNPSASVQEPQQTSPDPYAAVTLPENSLLSAQTLADFKHTAQTVHLPQEALQQWVQLEEERLRQEAVQAQQAQREQAQTWARQTEQLFGPRWQEEVSKAVRAADLFGGPQLREMLEQTGLGNHPAIVRTFHAVAKCMSEDILPGGVSNVVEDKTFTQALYGQQERR